MLIHVPPYLYRSHFGSRYKSGCCGHAGLLLFGGQFESGSRPQTTTRRTTANERGLRTKPLQEAEQQTKKQEFVGDEHVIAKALSLLDPHAFKYSDYTQQAEAYVAERASA